MYYENGFAIVGVGCRFPGDVATLDDLWQVLSRGLDVVTEVPEERFDLRRYWHASRKTPGRTCTVSAGVVGDLRQFDAAFFGMSPKEAEALDPQQRMILEMAWEAFEDAGIAPSSVRGSRTAVYVGAAATDMGMIHADDPAVMGPYSMTGTSLSIIANRLSYFFDLHGPSLTLDTACSSSLVALHEACRALSAGEADMALVGGVNVLLSPLSFVGFSKAHMLSQDGRCKVFDAEGNGYVRSEGGAVLLVKPLDAALRDGDAIHAVIRASGVNSDGRTNGIALPNGEAQKELLASIYHDERLSKERVAYVEAHGTGTAAGDPVETGSIGAVLGHASGEPLWVGSVKGNLGHLETGSGMAGLAKVIGVLEHGEIPPNCQLKNLNSKIDFAGLGLRVPQETVPLPKVEGRPLVGLNSFGFGGTNAHIVLEEAPEVPNVARTNACADDTALLPLRISAKSVPSLQMLATAYADRLATADFAEWNRVAAAAGTQRDRLAHALLVRAKTPEECVAALRAYAEEEKTIDGVSAVDRAVDEDATAKTAFVYSGNGSQWAGMARDFVAHPVFAKAVEEVDRIFAPLSGWKLADVLTAPEEAWNLALTEYAQPLLFVVQVGFTEMLRAEGLEPFAVTGHSVGEVAAAWASGALTLEDAVHVIYERSNQQAKTKGSGGMAAVKFDTAKLNELLADAPHVEVAGRNAPDNFTLSGHPAEMEAVGLRVKEAGGLYKKLALDYAFHSSAMAGLEAGIGEALAHIRPSDTTAAFVSSVTGGVLPGTELTADYWWRNIRQTVEFEKAVSTLLDLGVTRFVEVGPHPILSGYVRAVAKAKTVDIKLAGLLRRNETIDVFEKNLAQVLAFWPNYVWPEVPRDRTLPRYTWQKKPFWTQATTESWHLFDSEVVHPLLGRAVPHAAQTWESLTDLATSPWLAGHEIDETVLFPAAGFLETALAAARLSAAEKNEKGPAEIVNLAILRPMALEDETVKVVTTTVTPSGELTLASRDLLEKEALTHLMGRVATCHTPQPEAVKMARVLAGDAAARESVSDLYASLREIGLRYGGAFRAMEEAWTTADGRIVVRLVSRDAEADDGMLLPPALTDGALQGLFFALSKEAEKEGRRPTAYLPSWIGRTVLWKEGVPAWAEITIGRRSERSVQAKFLLRSADGVALAMLEDVRFLRVYHKNTTVEPAFYTEDWFVRTEDRAGLCPRNTKTIFDGMLRDTCRAFERSSERGAEAAELIHWLALAYIREAVVTENEWVPKLSLLTDGFVVPEEEAFAEHLADLLVENGLAEAEDDVVRVPTSEDAPSVELLYRTILSSEPALWPLLTALDRVGTHLSALLTGEKNLGDVLVVGKNDVRALFERTPVRTILRDATRTWLSELERRATSERARLSLLFVVDKGATFAEFHTLLTKKTSVTVAAVDKTARERLSSEFAHTAGVTVCDWADLAKNAKPQFDAVVLPEGLAFMENVETAVKTLAEALLPKGAVLLHEVAPNAALDFLEGADPAWWSVVDGRPTGRLAGVDEWLRVWREAGLTAVRADDESLAMAPAMAILAQKPAAPSADPTASANERSDEELEAELAAMPRSVYVYTKKRPDGTLTGGAVANAVEIAMANLVAAAKTEKAKALAGEVRLKVVAVDEEDAKNSEYWAARLTRLPAGSRVVTLLDYETTYKVPTDYPHALMALAKAVEAAHRAATLAEDAMFVAVTGNTAGFDGVTAPGNDASTGLGRVLANECPGVAIRSLTLVDETPATLAKAAKVLLAPEQENDTEGAIEEGRCYERLVSPWEKRETMDEIRSNRREAWQLAFGMPGRLDRLHWEKTTLTPDEELAPDEVRIDVRATGLNFRDVMWTMGLLPEEALENGFSGPSLGLEAAGVVRAVGRNVTKFVPGDAVVAFGPACFSTVMTTKENAVAKKPETLNFAEAASVPVAFFTAWYAMHHLGRAQPGESILIHGAAGGVGLAAIQIAAHLGLTVYATAGTPVKRDLLRRLGVEHVYDSRTLAFADEILRDTDGRGVDLVLNSLAGDGMEKSLSVLAPFGRFLELGKRDFFADSPLFLRPFRRNLSYFGIDVDQLLVYNAPLAATLFREVLSLFEADVFRPLPVTVFLADRAREAFQTMQASSHIGKIVVSYPDPTETTSGDKQAKVPSKGLEALTGTAIVTGGFGGLGRKVVRRLVERGAEAVVILSRKGAATDDNRAFVAELEAEGVTVAAPAIDIGAGRFDAFSRALEETLADLPPVTAAVHAAGVLADAAIVNLDEAACNRVWLAKLRGGERLARFLVSHDVSDDFRGVVYFSSATVLLGNPGQANYVAANRGLEAVATELRRRGRPAYVIGWGPVGDVGMLEQNEQAKKTLATTLGTPPLSAAEVVDAMEKAVREGILSSHFFAIDWQRVSSLPVATSRRFAEIWKEVGVDRTQNVAVRDLLLGKSKDEAVAILSDLVAGEIAKLMGMSVSELHVHRPVSDIGMDSLMVVELAVALEERIGLKIPAVSLSGGASIATMAERFWQMLQKSSEAEQELETLSGQHGLKLSDEIKSAVLDDVKTSH